MLSLIALAACRAAYADPVQPPTRQHPSICIYSYAAPGEDACETFQDGASEYCGGDPVNCVDPMGENALVVSGGPSPNPTRDAHDANWANFVTGATLRMSYLLKKAPTPPFALLGNSNPPPNTNEKVEWAVLKYAYEERATAEGKAANFYTKKIEAAASELGVILRWYNNTQELVTIINTAPDGTARSGDEKLSSFDIFSHGVPGEITPDIFNSRQASLKIADIASINASAFKENALSVSWACNSATPNVSGASIATEWQAKLGLQLNALTGRSDYAPTAGESGWTRAFSRLGDTTDRNTKIFFGAEHPGYPIPSKTPLNGVTPYWNTDPWSAIKTNKETIWKNP